MPYSDLSPLWISLKTAFVATIFAFLVGIAAARWMYGYRGKAKGLIDGFFTLPLVLPPTVIGFLLLLLLGRNSPVGQLLKQLGITIIFSWSATVIAATVVAFPLMYKTVLSAFKQIDKDLIHCARTLGASEWRIFWQILLPLALPGVVSGTILAFARALGEFGATLMLAGSIPGKTQTMPIAIFFAAEAGKMGEALNWVLLMVAIALLVIATINYWSGTQHSAKWHAIAHWFSWLPPFEGGREGDLKRGTRGRYKRTDYRGIRYGNKGLFVNLKKQLPGFTLDAQLEANGQPLGLLGTSGSGKSMTLRCIAGLDSPNQGRIVLNGRVLFDSQRGINIPSRQRRIGFVFQNYALFPHLTIVQNIAFGLQNLPKLERRQRISKYMEMMQLQGLENRYPEQISGGQQQRVALARALVIHPEALLLDEPLSALDTYLRSRIERLLSETLSTYEGVTLFVTHKLEEAYRICQNLLILSQGNVIANDTKETIFERPPSFEVAQVTECKNFSTARMIEPQTIEALDWGCTLQVVEPIPNKLTYVGIRAHHFTFPQHPDGENTFPCWLVMTSETQHRTTLYIKLHQPPGHAQDYHLQVEVYKEKWANLKDRPFPWYVRLDPLRLILMEQ
ncbi:molybdate ABC transporter, permease protein, putative [Coleofasciculus chthonoplastes PCC 7420]|uniref:Molybdate ABC transporter, permease protein, putative n=1 Tax=Coleofasciculus chthonoplastes PCC 7420 TaxID=118168 RepID=B4VJN3_9CYAN|nr:molybdate ABC transporter permease subunit [Coleofasciculus chthonoplastes]EDX77577.1 molybdate ABC transporter, permease protein, putative [Coleofasciculus chthonoplastes PCC 7420]